MSANRTSWHVLPATIVLAVGMMVPSVDSEFVFETAPFTSAHASTIVETRDGLVTAWFGGTREGAPDVGIWLSRHERDTWTAPIEIATGAQPDGTRLPCWNPVLVDIPGAALMLFYAAADQTCDVGSERTAVIAAYLSRKAATGKRDARRQERRDVQ